MAKQGQVTKIYELRTLGYDDLHKQLQAVSKDFDAIKKAKKAAEDALAGATGTEQIKKFSEEVNALKIKEQELRVQRQQMINESKAAQLARQEEIRQQKEVSKTTEAAAGSYNQLYQQWKQLYALTKAAPKGSQIQFQGQTLGYDEAIVKLKSLAAAEQDFRRQFARDGLLVAEYSSGIVQAFKQMGLGDVVGGQITKVKEKINSLNGDFERLKSEFQTAKQQGVGDLAAIEAKMVENRKEAVSLGTSVAQLQKDFRGTGNIGNQITHSISEGFKKIREQVAGFALTFIGVQAVLTKIESFGEGVSEAFQHMELAEAKFQGTLKNLGRENELEPLKKSIDELVQKFRFLNEADLKEATQKLLVFGRLSQEQIQQILPVIVDFATQQKISVQEAGDLFAKAIEGNARSLKPFGINIKEAASETGRFDLIMTQLGGKLKGTAETFDKTTSGALARNKESWIRIKEEIGQRLIPILTSVGTIIAGVAAFLLHIPFPLVIAGITAVTGALVLYKAEQIRAYVVTQLASQQGIIYNTYLLLQRARTLAVAAATRLATFEIVLFNGAIRISPIGIFLTLIGLVIPAVALFANKLKETKQAQSALNEVQKAASSIYAEQISKIDAWVAIIKSAATSADTKRKAVDNLIATNKEFSKVIKNNTIDLVELEKAYNKVSAAIQLQANVQASAQLVAEKEAKVVEVASARQLVEAAIATGQKDISDQLTKAQQDLIFSFKDVLAASGTVLGSGFRSNVEFDLQKVKAQLIKVEQERIAALQQFQNIQNKSNADLDAYLKQNQQAGAGFEVDIKALRLKLETLDKEIQDFQGSRSDLAAKVAERKKLQAELDKLLGTNKPTPESKLSVEQKDKFKDIEAQRDQLNAADEKRRLQSEVDEETYLDLIYANNIAAINKKLALLKGSSEEERKVIAELNLEKVKLEKDINDKIFNIRQNALKQQLDQQIADVDLQRDRALIDPNLSATARAQIKLDADNKILSLQIKFNEDIDRLEKQLAQRSLANTKESAEAIKKTREEILKDQKELADAALKDIGVGADELKAELNIRYEILRQAILNNDKLTADQREKALQKLAKIHNVTILSAELARLTTEFNEIKKQYEKGLKTEKDFLEAKEKMEKAKGDLDQGKSDLAANNIDLPSASNTQKIFSDQLGKLFGFAKGSPEAQLLGETISQSFSLAKDAMNSYFDAERSRIQDSLQANLQRLDLEKEQVKARAQSQAEIDSIEKQYEVKKKAAQAKAGEELKKSKRSEAKIALATELANIAVSAAANPANAVTFGAAGVIMYGILSALAIARYALNVAAINREKFGRGGAPTKTGGQAEGPSHAHGGIPFNYEAEGKELFIINKKSAEDNKVRTISGTNKQIASLINQIGGGIKFAGGAKQLKFAQGGYLGSKLQAPVFTPSSSSTFISSGITKEDLKELTKGMEKMAEETSKRIDRLQVEQVTRTVTNAQKKQVKQSNIAML